MSVSDAGATVAVSQAGPSLAAPATVWLPVVQREGNKYLKIVDVQNRRVVTVVEILSPANKQPGPDREAYLNKRIEYLAAGVNLVEIDLLRSGRRLPFGDPPPALADYYVLVCRASEMPQAGVWPIRLRDTLPCIPVPLDPGVPDVPLMLKTCVDRAYDEGRYDREIDYTHPPNPPLETADASWAEARLADQVRVR